MKVALVPLAIGALTTWLLAGPFAHGSGTPHFRFTKFTSWPPWRSSKR